VTTGLSPARTASPAGPASRADAWDGGESRWHAYFAVVLAGMLTVIQVTGSASGQARLIASAALLAMVPWYLLVGRRALYASDQPPWLGAAYLGGLLPLLAVTEAFAGSDTVILLALGPQCFMALSYRRAIAAVGVLNAVPLGVALARDHGEAAVTLAVAVAVLGTAFCVAFGTWIIKIIDQSAERAELIAQLEATRAELAEVSREAGILAERDRLASEIHDTIAQGFSSIVMLAQAAEAVIDDDRDRARKQLDLIGRTARENLAEARSLVAGLVPVPLARASLADALARLAGRAGEELGVRTDFAVRGSPRPLGTGTEVVLLRVCQEALSNVRKHAGATLVRVALSYCDEGVRLEVTDDGAGFDPEHAGGGFGLRGMRARVSEIGGELTVRSAPGDGTKVSAELP
jgi:signal transduction histidine kinase